MRFSQATGWLLVLVLAVLTEVSFAEDKEPVGRKAAELLERLKKTFGVEKDDTLDLDAVEKQFFAFFDMGPAEERMKAAAREAAKLVATDQDTLALVAFIDGDLAKARELFRKSIEKKPDRPLPEYFVGVVAYEIADFDAAERHFDRTIQLCPGARTGYVMRALSRLRKDKPVVSTAAVALFSRRKRRPRRDSSLPR